MAGLVGGGEVIIRRTVIAALAAAAFGVSAISPAGAAGGAPWSQTDANAAMSRANASERILSATSVKRVVARHRFSVKPTSDCCFAAPVLTGGRLYVAVGNGVDAHNAATGKLVWHKTVVTDTSYAYCLRYLSVVGGRVYVGLQDCESQSDPVGYVVALNAATGATVWNSRRTSDVNGSLQSMVVSGGYVISAGSSVASGSAVIALHASDGTSAWSRGGSCTGGDTAIVVAGKVIYDDGCNADRTKNHLVAYWLGSGARAWSRTGDWTVQRGDNDGVTTGHHIYAYDGSAVSDINPKNGTTRFVLAGAHYVLADDVRHVYATCFQRSICAYDTATGVRQWQRADIRGLAPGISVAAANGLLYLPTGPVLSSATGRTVRTFPYHARAVVVGDGRIAAQFDRALTLYVLPGS